MTIALGLKALDGIVLASDSEYAGGAYDKTSGPKVFTRNGEFRRPTKPPISHAIGITGAGTVSHIEAIKDELLDAYSSEMWQPHISEQELTFCFSPVLTGFYANHILPFSQYPPDERPDIALMIATSRGSFESLWVTEGTTIRTENHFAAVGMGTFTANELLRKLWWESEVLTMALLAIYVIQEVKQTVPSCGQQTQICCLTDGKVRIINPHYVDDIEKTFRKYWATQRMAFYNTVGSLNPSPTWEEVTSSFSNIRSELQSFTSELRKGLFEP